MAFTVSEWMEQHAGDDDLPDLGYIQGSLREIEDSGGLGVALTVPDILDHEQDPDFDEIIGALLTDIGTLSANRNFTFKSETHDYEYERGDDDLLAFTGGRHDDDLGDVMLSSGDATRYSDDFNRTDIDTLVGSVDFLNSEATPGYELYDEATDGLVGSTLKEVQKLLLYSMKMPSKNDD